MADQTLVEGFLHVQQFHRFALSELLHRHAGPGSHDLGDILFGDDGIPLADGNLAGFGCNRGGNSRIRVLSAFAGFAITARLKDGADLVAQFHFSVAQFSRLGEVLIANGVLLLLLHGP